MSAKIYAYTHWVEGYKEKTSQNLKLPIEKDDGDLFFIKGYNVSFNFDYIVACLSYTDAYAYWIYFVKDSFLRTECFDVIRALGLKEMWVMNEMMTDILDEDGYTLENALKKITNYCPDKTCHEFNVEEVNEHHFYPFYHDNFSDLFEEVDKLEKKFNVHVLGLQCYLDPITNEKRIRVLKENKIYFMEKETGKLTEVKE